MSRLNIFSAYTRLIDDVTAILPNAPVPKTALGSDGTNMASYIRPTSPAFYTQIVMFQDKIRLF